MIPFGTTDTPDHLIDDGKTRIRFRDGVFGAERGEELRLLLHNGRTFPLMNIKADIKGHLPELRKGELKRWLELLGERTDGKRAELVERLTDIYRKDDDDI